MSWIDLSLPVRPGMVHWPGDPQYRIDRISDFSKGDEMVLSQIALGVHTGTHMDAPLHFLLGGAPIDEMPLDATIGEARVVEVQNPKTVEPEELETAWIEPGERILLKTTNSTLRLSTDDFQEDFVYISSAGAEYLASRRIRAVGIDYLSVGGFHRDGPETHRALLGAGIWVIEGLNLGSVQAGRYELVCVPLKLIGAEGAPARAIARRIPSRE